MKKGISKEKTSTKGTEQGDSICISPCLQVVIVQPELNVLFSFWVSKIKENSQSEAKCTSGVLIVYVYSSSINTTSPQNRVLQWCARQ
jgi:hypothetical protein